MNHFMLWSETWNVSYKVYDVHICIYTYVCTIMYFQLTKYDRDQEWNISRWNTPFRRRNISGPKHFAVTLRVYARTKPIPFHVWIDLFSTIDRCYQRKFVFVKRDSRVKTMEKPPSLLSQVWIFKTRSSFILLLCFLLWAFKYFLFFGIIGLK